MTNRFRILVALDTSEYGEIVLEHGFDQAARHDASDLHFLAVVKPKGDAEAMKNWLANVVIDGMDDFHNGHDWHARIHVLAGDPASEIANFASEIGAQLIVMGRFGLHGRHSTADRVLERAPCPTLVVGLGGLEVDPNPQCPDCATVRADSDGERWFCNAHAAPDRLHLSSLVPSYTANRGSIY